MAYDVSQWRAFFWATGDTVWVQVGQCGFWCGASVTNDGVVDRLVVVDPWNGILTIGMGIERHECDPAYRYQHTQHLHKRE